MAEEKIKPPLGIKIISILFFTIVSFGLLFIFGLFFTTSNDIADWGLSPNSLFESSIFYSFISIILLALGIFLWRRANWARISTIIFSFCIIVGSWAILLNNLFMIRTDLLVYSIFIFLFILYCFVFIYLTFNRKVRNMFNINSISRFEKIITILLIIFIAFLLIIFTIIP